MQTIERIQTSENLNPEKKKIYESIQYFHKHTNLSLAVQSSEFLKFVVHLKTLRLDTNNNKYSKEKAKWNRIK